MVKTNKFCSLWILFRCYWSSFKTIFVVMYLSRFNKHAAIDQALVNWSQDLLKILKVNYRVHNPYQVDLKQQGNKYILMSNHASLFDIPLIFVAIPGRIRMLAKKELFRIPLFGQAMKAAGFPAVDRNNTAQAIKDLDALKLQMIHEGIVPWIAPEGTRSRDGSLQAFKTGGFMLALQTEATIIPVAIRGASKILPPDTMNFNLGETIEIHIEEPIDASQFTIQTRKQLLAAVRKKIQSGLGEEIA